MRETVETVKLNDGQVVYQSNIEFESSYEAESFLSNLREGLSLQDVQNSIAFFENDDNKQKFAHVFAHIWVLINIARQSETSKDFEIFLKYNTMFYKLFEETDPEILKLILIFVDISSKTRVRRYASTKEVRRRLEPVKIKLRSLLPSDFDFYPLNKLPDMNIQQA